MLGIIAQEKIELRTFPENMKTLFSSYPDISDMLINKVIFDTKDEEDMQVFFDSLSSVNEENKKGNISEPEEKLLVESFRTLLANYDGMKLQVRQLNETKILEEKEKNSLSGDNLDLIF